MYTANKINTPATEIKSNKIFFQAKLTINQPNDVYEQEADAVADKVMHLKAPLLSSQRGKDYFFKPSNAYFSFGKPVPIFREGRGEAVHRQCAHCEEEKKMQRKEIGNNETIIQRQDENEGQQTGSAYQFPPLIPPLSLKPPYDSIDYLGLQQTFFNRGLIFPGSYMNSAQQEWGRQYQFYNQLGLGGFVGNSFTGNALKFFGVTPPGGDWNAWLANTTTPLAVDSALSHDFPNFNEQEERRGGLPAPTIINAPAIHFKKANSGQTSAAGITNESENYIHNLSGGNPLSNDEKTFFEPRINADFSSVRIHHDNAANESAKSLNALAYTQGNNIVFGAGQYRPHTNDGKRLMAHELTHVVQQNSGHNMQRIQKTEAPSKWCNAFMDLVRYEDAHGKLNVMQHYNFFPELFGGQTLIPLNHDIPSVHGDVDVDWMFRLALIQYPFILASIFSPSMAEGFGLIASYVGYMGAKAFWNTVRAIAPEWRLEYGSIFDEANWNSASAIVDWIHHDKSLREIFVPAVQICEQQGY